MKKLLLACFAFLFLLSLLSGKSIFARRDQSKLSPAVRSHLLVGNQSPLKVWIYFADHAERDLLDLQQMIGEVKLSERALTRRINRSRGPLIDKHDLPISPEYISRVSATGCELKKVSKYLNAVSAIATPQQIAALKHLSFVKKIDKVHTFHRRLQPDIKEPNYPGAADGGLGASKSAVVDTPYGPSFKQLDLMNVIPLHEAGVHGEGVLVAMLDTGFNRHHVSLGHLDVIAEWDFINNDSITRNEPGDPFGQDNHGTYTLSALAGYAPGDLIGPAWGASFALAKTEQIDTEIQIEEDDWVRGVEWAESLGADVVSSSLGYLDWYTYEDLDGNTAVTTKAADIAAAKGLTVVTAAGNEGPLPWPGIIAPSDGDSVVAVGAVDSNGVIVNFSSRGPAFDGRIKPDVVAQGLAVVSAAPWDSLGYLRVSGTSLSTPLVAGACALILKMHPYWTPVDLLTALKNAASQSNNPDNDYGWGIINAYVTALNGSTGVEGALLDYRVIDGGVELYIIIPNPQSTRFDLLRQKLLSGQDNTWSSFEMVEANFLVSALEAYVVVDRNLPGGVYRYRIQVHGNSSVYKDLRSPLVLLPFRLSLHQNYPNPFSPSIAGKTRIRFDIGGSPPPPGSQPPLSILMDVSLTIYDVRGARIKSLYSGLASPGEHYFDWDGTSDIGSRVASGVYYYRLLAGGAAQSKKIVVINP